MRKVEFGISDASTEERLMSGWDKIDLVNTQGEYLDIIRLGNKSFLVTKTLMSGDGQYDGRIMVNEIEKDIFADGSVVFYYNTEKSVESIALQQRLNHPEIIKELNSKSIREILGFNESLYSSPLQKEFESKFNGFGNIYSKDESLDYRIVITGLDGKLFERLKESKKSHMTMYEMYNRIQKLEKELKVEQSKIR